MLAPGGSRVLEDAAGWRDRLSTVAAAPADRGDPSAVFIRPDGIVAWAPPRACPRTPQLWRPPRACPRTPPLWRPRCAPGSANRTHV
ncbi:hypothetical protein ACFVRD_31995 [Streptomyces sp. NPDC057908]|uniref:aromatic-ring hydroxylase C-terminal domain-containing protein n=1 Tax=Streptomyces sp. NPDC057908 TaxID=3346276 RepID=UPI0036EECF3B